MALEIEDGTAKANAESYATAAQLLARARALGATVPTRESDLEILLRKAMGKMQRGDDFKGYRVSRDQALDFPRSDVVVAGFLYDSDEIPPQLIEAQILFAIAANSTTLEPVVERNASGAVIERTVASITTRYADPGLVQQAPKVQAAERAIRPLLKGVGANNIPISRA